MGSVSWPRIVQEAKLAFVRRLLVIAMVLLSLAVQGVSLAGQRAAAGEGLSHELLHLQDIPHHHHDSGDGDDLLMFDQSAESASHLASDGASSSPAIPPVAGWDTLAGAAVSPPIPQFMVPWGPDPQGLRKPPRLNA